jgi:hypothetical protein
MISMHDIVLQTASNYIDQGNKKNVDGFSDTVLVCILLV